jgi:heme/copper-type cytochrome/quinol oxidase subunit 2
VGRLGRLSLSGPASAALLLLMLAGCLFMLVGVPLLWLWVGSQLQGSVELGTALMVMMLGALATILATAPLLVGLNRRYVEIRAARGQPVGESSPLEVILVVTAVLAIIGCSIWFFGFSGSSPLPLNLSY